MSNIGRKVFLVGQLGFCPNDRLTCPAKRLLAYVALSGGQIPRREAAYALWPDLAEDAGRANLRRTLWRTPKEWLESESDELILNAECDLPEARHAAAQAMRGQPLTFDDLDLLSRDLLPGWHEEWAMVAQDSFRLIRVQALEAASKILIAHGNHALAVQAASAALAAEPLRESAAEMLIDAHLAQGNRFAAVQCFKAIAHKLDEELGVSPDLSLVERMSRIGLKLNAA